VARFASVYPLVTARALARQFTYEVPDDVEPGAVVDLQVWEGRSLDVVREAVADDREAIALALKRLVDSERVRFVFTTGGTGLTTDDVTPEATRDVIDREAPGYAETIRAESRRHTPLGILTRGVSGIRGRTLIVNFPGNPKAIEQSWPVVEPTLEHAAATLERD
jgi:molybdenum cofactor synthesis domain-containing protein